MRPAAHVVPRVSNVPAPADQPVEEESLPDKARQATLVQPSPKVHGSEAADDDSLDALQDLGDEIATLAAHIHAAEHRFLMLIGEFDRLEGWKPGGHRSCAHWLAFRTGIGLGAARERLRAARALENLPGISASMEQGELSFAQVRALTRVATPESEGALLELAHCSTAAQLERVVRAWRRLSRHDEQELERMRHRSRCFSVFPDEEGMYLVRGRLDPEVGAMLIRAVDAAGDALFRRNASEEIEPKQRRADAVGLLAEMALAVGFGHADREDLQGVGGVAEGTTRKGSGAERESDDATDTETGADPTPRSGSRAERFQVVLHVEAATLDRDSEPGRSELEDGTRVSAETSRRLSCDASVVRISEAPDGSILDIGRKTRTIPPALRRALESRDRGCRFPGCGLRFTDAHHVRHWADGGETKLEHLVLLCRFHHRLVHEEGYTVHAPGGGSSSRRQRLYFLDRKMRMIPETPKPAPALPLEPTAALMRQNRSRGIEPDYYTSSARYKREEDIPYGILARALEALEESVE